MNKAVRVNISGAVFNIDEDAYQKLKDYIDNLNDYYAADPDGKDIVEDIENRIAELLHEALNSYREVVNIHDIEQVIETLGSPFDDTENFISPKISGYKRIFRNPEDRILGGVCGGLGAYFGISPNLIRLAFLLSVIFFGAGTLLYLVLWILIPLAKTSTDLLEMRGEPITIKNIEKAIRKEFEKVKRSLKFK